MKTIRPSVINGVVHAPPSKSSMIRAVAASLFAHGISEIKNPSFCDDALTALHIARMLGAEIYKEKEKVLIKGNGDLVERDFRGYTLQCNESGLCLRMFAPIVALAHKEFTLEAKGSLLLRPVGMVEALNLLNARCNTNNGFAPVRVMGRLKGGDITIKGSDGSQFISGLIMALSLCGEDSTIRVLDLKSRPYIRLTLDTMEKFGVVAYWRGGLDEFLIPGQQRYKPSVFLVEGDWSGAAFFLVAGAIAGSIRVKGIDIASSQGDKTIMEVLSNAGAKIEIDDGEVLVEKSRLKAFSFDATDSPDLFPPLVALAANCEGVSTIYGVDRLKHKESDRASALMDEFKKLGIKIDVTQNRMEIRGGTIKGRVVESHNDHRIAMACAIAGLTSTDPVMINNHGCVAKSYPTFFNDLNSVRKEI